MMDRRQREDLDRHITGNYGADQEREEREWDVDEDGIEVRTHTKSKMDGGDGLDREDYTKAGRGDPDSIQRRVEQDARSEWLLADDDKRFVYQLNDEGHNRWSFCVQGPHTPREELEAVAILCRAAPRLLAACLAQHQAIDALMARLVGTDPTFMPSKSGQPWDAIRQGIAAIARARGQ